MDKIHCDPFHYVFTLNHTCGGIKCGFYQLFQVNSVLICFSKKQMYSLFLCLDFMSKKSDMRSGDGEPSAQMFGVLLGLQDAVVTWMSRARQRVIQGFTVFSIVFLLLWISAFLYGSFYYSYMPMAAFSTPVHYHYRCVCNILSSCIRL